jgi:CheY-like chemotaxis protein
MSNEPAKPGARIILVVDDNPVILKAMSMALSSKGY